MFGEDKNLKDSEEKSPTPYETDSSNVSLMLSYTKTNKLITALYMVTDMIEKDEPIRIKLRTLGAGIISDMNAKLADASTKIYEIMSFLDIASAINIISTMNSNILRKEFLELDQSIKEAVGTNTNKNNHSNRQINLSEFFTEEQPTKPFQFKGQYQPIGQNNSTRIGVQKAGTLMKVLSDRKLAMSFRGKVMSDRNTDFKNVENFDLLKKQRRDEILKSIKGIGGNATITDIKNNAQGLILSVSEKTLQRELVSMVKDGVLDKTGEKRWSKYLIK